VKIELVPSAVTGILGDPHQYATSVLINDTVCIDAGSIGFYRTPDDQAKVKHIFISHSHMDHVASLPTFLENVFMGDGKCPSIYASEVVWTSLKGDLFNGRVWPDFIGMSETFMKATPFLKCETIASGQTIEVEGLRISMVSVDHLIPCLGFIVEDDRSTVVIPSDTGPTEAIWVEAKKRSNLKAVILEVAFPNSMAGLAKAACHFIPSNYGEEVRKVNDGPRKVPFLAVHLKARYREKVAQELDDLGLEEIQVARFGTPYVF
jgi:ribonuclease BN (tRNA processing enzyme)